MIEKHSSWKVIANVVFRVVFFIGIRGFFSVLTFTLLLLINVFAYDIFSIWVFAIIGFLAIICDLGICFLIGSRHSKKDFYFGKRLKLALTSTLVPIILILLYSIFLVLSLTWLRPRWFTDSREYYTFISGTLFVGFVFIFDGRSLGGLNLGIEGIKYFFLMYIVTIILTCVAYIAGYFIMAKIRSNKKDNILSEN